MSEKVYIVPGESYLRRCWRELLDSPRPFDPDRVPEKKLAGSIDCWFMHT